MTGLAQLVAQEHAGWARPVVDEAVFGTSDPGRVARAIEGHCATELGSRVSEALFYRVGVGCVAGVALLDGRRVVVKVQRAAREAHLLACIEVRRHLRALGFPCPLPLAVPSRLGEAWATFEELDDRGDPADAHAPAIRRALARGLAGLVEGAKDFSLHPGLGPAWFTRALDGKTFPRPHSPLFDFEATRHGAAWIEDLAARAREQRAAAAGVRVVGHFDWRVEHARFEGDRLVATYDWDSLHAELEPVMVGAAAHAFTADWARAEIPKVPSVAEMRAFAEEYEDARGRSFDAAERKTLTASLVYSLAYTARCGHALGEREDPSRDFRPLLREHGDRLLREGLFSS